MNISVVKEIGGTDYEGRPPRIEWRPVGAMALADRVKELRQKLGLKQAALSQESGISQATISRIESGKISQPKMGELRKLADALGVTIDYLAGDRIQDFSVKQEPWDEVSEHE